MLDEDGVGRQVAVDDGRRARVKVAAKTRGLIIFACWRQKIFTNLRAESI